MSKCKIAIVSLLGLLLTTSSALAFSAGDWVLGKYRNGPYWYPGVVQSADSSGTVTIAYDDGDREVLPHALVRPYLWQVGTRVQCNWQRRGRWYSGTIAALNGGAVFIHYDDGDREQTSTGMCRSG